MDVHAGQMALARCIAELAGRPAERDQAAIWTIHSAAGLLDPEGNGWPRRPVRFPHPSAMRLAITGEAGRESGGGEPAGMARPCELTLENAERPRPQRGRREAAERAPAARSRVRDRAPVGKHAAHHCACAPRACAGPLGPRFPSAALAVGARPAPDRAWSAGQGRGEPLDLVPLMPARPRLLERLLQPGARRPQSLVSLIVLRLPRRSPLPVALLTSFARSRVPTAWRRPWPWPE